MNKKLLVLVIFFIVSIFGIVVFLNNQKKFDSGGMARNTKQVSAPKNDKAIIIHNSEEYRNISDLINKEEFKGNVLYVDIWSLTCAPCIKEFQVLAELKERYKDSSVVFVYLVDFIESDHDNKKWKQFIIKYGLSGYHLKMSSIFYHNIQSIDGIRFGGKPHFILVNKNGEIAFPNAARPSSKEKLYDQIDQLL